MLLLLLLVAAGCAIDLHHPVHLLLLVVVVVLLLLLVVVMISTIIVSTWLLRVWLLVLLQCLSQSWQVSGTSTSDPPVGVLTQLVKEGKQQLVPDIEWHRGKNQTHAGGHGLQSRSKRNNGPAAAAATTAAAGMNVSSTDMC
jgi:hypothetical protein